MLGDKALFPDAAHPEVSALEPDCRCEPPQPMLRCASFNKEGRACWLLVNEGNAPIRTQLTLPVDAPLCRYDLWNGQPCACPAEHTAKGTCLPLELPVRGSLLLFTCTGAEYAELPAACAAYKLPCPKFEFVCCDPVSAQKTYKAQLTVTQAQLAKRHLQLTVSAEEMAELTVNGKSAGVAFWSPQTFEPDNLLQAGENELVLTVTGNMANLHGKHPVPYGLK